MTEPPRNINPDRYKYQALPPLLPQGRTPPYTRLVRIFPGSGNGPIHCSLFIVNIESAPRYEALSYVWGPPSGSLEPYVLCDGRPVCITPNLDGALRWLRYPHQERLLWIDAICIDQENIDERSRQVGYMRLVYKFASRAVIWLGKKQPGMDMAFDMARRMQILNDMPELVPGEELPELHSMLGMTEDEFEIGTFYLSELLDVEYFCRIWCVQEVVASQVTLAKSEDQEMDFQDLLRLVQFIIEARGKLIPDKPLAFWANISVARGLRGDERLNGSVGPLLSMLAGTRDFKATDPRDKVFALFGVSDEGCAPELALTKIMGDNNSLKLRLLRKAVRGLNDFINDNAPAGSREFGRPVALTPDYRKDVNLVFRDLTRFFIRASPRVLDVLSHVQHTSPPDPKVGPSWVPDWNEKRQVSILSVGMFLAGFCNGHYRYFANIGDNPLYGQPQEPDKLRIEGFKIDQIVKVSDVMSFALHEEWPAETIWNQLFDFPLFSYDENQVMRSYRNGDRLDVAFLLTATAYPLGSLTFKLDPQSIQSFAAMGDAAIPAFKAEARADVSAVILANTPLDTTLLPQYATINLEAQGGEVAKFNRVAKMFSHNRRFYFTRSGYMGIGPRFMQPGDEVCALFGGRPTYILRPMGDHHIFMGDSYIMDDHIMWGKATEQVRRTTTSGIPIVSFELR